MGGGPGLRNWSTQGANLVKLKLNARPDLMWRILRALYGKLGCVCSRGKNGTHKAGRMLSADGSSLKDKLSFSGETIISLGNEGHGSGRDGQQKVAAFT